MFFYAIKINSKQFKIDSKQPHKPATIRPKAVNLTGKIPYPIISHFFMHHI